jgi:hypothetical protein
VLLDAAHTTDTPVWWLDVATCALALFTLGLFIVTGVLARAAWKALDQLRVAIEEIEEVRKDRHVQVFSDLGERWQSKEMAEAFMLEQRYSSAELADLFARRTGDAPSWNPIRERRRLRDASARIVLLRVPSYFEDAVMTAKAGGLDKDLFADNFGGAAVGEWKRWESAVGQIRRDDDLAYVEFERLAVEVAAQDERRRATANDASQR